jgi:hypothetical protein
MINFVNRSPILVEIDQETCFLSGCFLLDLFWIFFFLSVWSLNSEPYIPRPECHSWVMSQSFVLAVFEIGPCCMSRPAWTVILSVLSSLVGMTVAHYCAQPLVEMGAHELFTWLNCFSKFSLPEYLRFQAWAIMPHMRFFNNHMSCHIFPNPSVMNWAWNKK